MQKVILIVILILSTLETVGQNCFGEYSTKSDFCSHTINLWEDSTFFIEFGCEGRSNILYGNFQVKNEKVYLRPINRDEFNLIVNLSWVDSIKELNITEELAPCVVLVDKNGKPINNQSVVLYDSQGTYYKSDISRNGSYLTPSLNADEIYLPEISLIFKRFVLVKIPENPYEKDILIIRLNINSSFLQYSQIKHVSNEMNYLFKNDTLRLETSSGISILEKVEKE